MTGTSEERQERSRAEWALSWFCARQRAASPLSHRCSGPMARSFTPRCAYVLKENAVMDGLIRLGALHVTGANDLLPLLQAWLKVGGTIWAKSCFFCCREAVTVTWHSRASSLSRIAGVLPSLFL